MFPKFQIKISICSDIMSDVSVPRGARAPERVTQVVIYELPEIYLEMRGMSTNILLFDLTIETSGRRY